MIQSSIRRLMMDKFTTLIQENEGLNYKDRSMEYKIEDSNIYYNINSGDIYEDDILDPEWELVNLKTMDIEDMFDELKALCDAIDERDGEQK